MSETVVLDAKGLKCPLPVLRARKAIKPLAAGDLLEVLATDPSAPDDFRSFAETTGHALEEVREEGGVYLIRVRKAG